MQQGLSLYSDPMNSIWYHPVIDEVASMEQYGNEFGLAALIWLNIFDADNRHSTWISAWEWLTDEDTLVLDKWTLIVSDLRLQILQSLQHGMCE